MGHLFDSFVNFVSSLGTDKDKTIHAQYAMRGLDRNQLQIAYRGDWVARKLVDIPAQDATREWREWEASDTQIDALEAEEKRHDLQRKTKLALIRARLYGGSAMIMGVGTGATSEELKPEAVAKEGLEFIHVVCKHDLTCGPLVDDITSPFFNEPSYYERQSGVKGLVRIHPSRVVRFQGNELPDPALSSDGWGDSVLQALDDAIKAVGIVHGGIATLVQEAKIDIIKIPEFTDKIGTQEYADRLTKRFTYANVAKSTINALLLDKMEEWERVNAQFAGLPDIFKMYLLVACGAGDIPATRFLGQSPSGLSATGDSDTRNYYDKVGADQRTIIQPSIMRLDEVLIRSALGSRDPKLHYNWRPLWQLSETDKAERDYKNAQAHKIDVDAGIINIDALRIGRENQLVENGVYPGFEAALREADKEAQPDLTELSIEEQAAQEKEKLLAGKPPVAAIGGPKPQLQIAGPKRPGIAKKVADMRRRINDAKPRTLYVYRELLNTEEFFAWAREQGFKNVLDDPHVTIAYSRAPIDWMKVGSDWYGGDKNGKLTVQPGGARIVERLGPRGAVVLLFNSSDLAWRWKSICAAGAEWQYGDDYQPHITIEYDPAGNDVEKMGDEDLDNVEPYRGELVFGPEIFEEIDDAYGAGAADLTAMAEIGDRMKRRRRLAPPALAQRTYDHAPAPIDVAALVQQIGDRMVEAVRSQPAPTIHVTLPRNGKVVKDIKHDEKGRVAQIIEHEEDEA